MKVNFIIHSAGKTGGIVVVVEHARRLQAAGHDVRVYCPLLPYPIYSHAPGLARRLWRYARALGFSLAHRGPEFPWSQGTPGLTSVPWIHSLFIRDADAVIATAWPTAYSVAKLPSRKGVKFYLVQGYEIWNGDVDRVDASYRLPLNLITIAPWLTDLMRTRFGRSAVEVRNGVDLDSFRPPPEKPAGPPGILMMYHTQGVKGIPDGLEVLRRLHGSHPEIPIRMFGLYPFPAKEAFIEYHPDPGREQLVNLYQQSQIFLNSSLSEGWQLPPMEAMACGCAVVATRVGCIPALEKDGNLLSAVPGDREALFAHADRLVRDADLRRETARKGYETILEYS